MNSSTGINRNHILYMAKMFLLLNVTFFRNSIYVDSHEHERKKETVRFIQQLAHTDGKLKSPIDLNISYMKVVNLNPIQWINYNVTPKKLKLTNTGYTGKK